MKKGTEFEKSYQTLTNAWFKALKFLQHKKNKGNSKVALHIRIVNHNEEIIGTRKGKYRVLISVDSKKGKMSLVNHYKKTLNFPVIDEISEKVFKKFIRFLLDNNKVYSVSNLGIFSDDFYPFNDDELNMFISLVINKDTVLSLPRNDLEYLDVIAEASNKCLIKNFDLLKFLKGYGYAVEGYVEKDYECKNTMEYVKYLIKNYDSLTEEEKFFLLEFRKNAYVD